MLFSSSSRSSPAAPPPPPPCRHTADGRRRKRGFVVDYSSLEYEIARDIVESGEADAMAMIYSTAYPSFARHLRLFIERMLHLGFELVFVGTCASGRCPCRGQRRRKYSLCSPSRENISAQRHSPTARPPLAADPASGVDAAWEDKTETWLERACSRLQQKRAFLADLASGAVDVASYADPRQASPPSGTHQLASDIIATYDGACVRSWKS